MKDLKKCGSLVDTYQGVFVDARTDIPVRLSLMPSCHADTLITSTWQSLLAVKFVRCDPKNAAIRQTVLWVRKLYIHMICSFIVIIVSSRH